MIIFRDKGKKIKRFFLFIKKNYFCFQCDRCCCTCGGDGSNDGDEIDKGSNNHDGRV